MRLPLPTAIASALLLGACENPNPGAALGTFSVKSHLMTNTCGGTAANLDPGDFDVTISNDHGIIYWFPQTGASSAQGGLGGNGTVTINETVSDNVDGVNGKAGPCTMDRTDALTFTFARGPLPASFTGTYGFTVAAASGANCTDQLTTNGGGYGALPCTLTYSLAGERR